MRVPVYPHFLLRYSEYLSTVYTHHDETIFYARTVMVTPFQRFVESVSGCQVPHYDGTLFFECPSFVIRKYRFNYVDEFCYDKGLTPFDLLRVLRLKRYIQCVDNMRTAELFTYLPYHESVEPTKTSERIYWQSC
jgi:hypothetical protein